MADRHFRHRRPAVIYDAEVIAIASQANESLRDIAKELRLMNDLTIEAMPEGITRSDWVKRAQWRRDA